MFAPYFPEYKMFIESGAGAKCVIVPPSIADFQIDFGALEQRLNEHSIWISLRYHSSSGPTTR